MPSLSIIFVTFGWYFMFQIFSLYFQGTSHLNVIIWNQEASIGFSCYAMIQSFRHLFCIHSLPFSFFFFIVTPKCSKTTTPKIDSYWSYLLQQKLFSSVSNFIGTYPIHTTHIDCVQRVCFNYFSLFEDHFAAQIFFCGKCVYINLSMLSLKSNQKTI